MEASRTSRGVGVLALSLLALAQPATSHSWVERAFRVAPNGTMVGQAGYQRNYTGRTDPGFTDVLDQLRIPPNPRNTILPTDLMCKDLIGSYKADYPMLQAVPGDYIALQHLENGHVTIPQNQPNKPLNRGTIYIYGTTQPSDNDTVLGIHLQWNADGTGGDGRGKLLATRNFDDGQCYEANSSPISQQRQQEFKKEAVNPMGANLYCQADLQLPTDLEVSSTYTLYWYWDWPYLNPATMDINSTANGTYPSSILAGTDDRVVTAESYSSCLEIAIGAPSAELVSENTDMAVSFIQGQDLNYAAVQDQLDGNYQVEVPTDDNGADNQSSNQPSTSTEGGQVVVVVTAEPVTVTETAYVTVDVIATSMAVIEATETSGIVAAAQTIVQNGPPVVSPFLRERMTNLRRRVPGARELDHH